MQPKKALGPVILLTAGLIAIVLLAIFIPKWREYHHREASDVAAIKGKIYGLCDDWIGYFPLRSSEMRSAMLKSGWSFKCEDDKAEYAARMERLKNGEAQFVVATVDTDIIHEAPRLFPGVQITVIDESFGGDAVLSWEDKIPNLDALKGRKDIRIGYMAGTPSHHLAKVAANHFGIPELLDKTIWVETKSPQETLKKFFAKELDVVITWEPNVSVALQKTGVKKLLGTEDTRRVIVDVLIVNRKFSEKNHEAVKDLLRNYFKVLKMYMDDRTRLENDVASETGLPMNSVRTMLKGVKWVNLTDNAQQWFGITPPGETQSAFGLSDTIDATVKILMQSGDFLQNPLPEKEPIRLTNNKYIKELLEELSVGFTVPGNKQTDSLDPLSAPFSPLGEEAWLRLHPVATLKIENITFQGGSADLTEEDREKMAAIAEKIRNYPRLRIQVKGHTGKLGDPGSNLALSQERAEKVTRYFSVAFSVDPNRLRAIGVGSQEPIPCRPLECKYVLPRVEITLLSEVY